MRGDKRFKFEVTLDVAALWIEDGVTGAAIAERMKAWLQEELNPFSVEGEFRAKVKQVKGGAR
jgi:hypothetical protein